MSTTSSRVPTVARTAGGRSYRWAWLSLAGCSLSLVLALAVGEGLLALLGPPGNGEERPPLWMVLVAGVPALVVLVVPGALAAWFGFRVVREGRPAGRWPAWIGIGSGRS